MAYSRWLDSVWYTYHCASSGDTRDDQTLWVGHKHIKGSERIGYKLLKDVYLPSSVIRIIFGDRFPEATTEELEELENYIFSFMQDVEGQYPDETDANEDR